MNRRKQKTRPAGSEAGEWNPSATRPPIARREFILVAMLSLAGSALRVSYPQNISVEHWDEAVYSSNIFLAGGYPFRHLYAPPLVPAIIEWSMAALGPNSFAAVLPNLVFGILLIPLCWWAGREWFGPSAGCASAALAAFSDFDVLYTRTTLTEPSLCFFFLLAVYFAWRAIARNNPREMVVAGAAIGAAWSTKYNGWLPLAVAGSGFVAWSLFERLDRRQWQPRAGIVVGMAVVAGLFWIPTWLSLPNGYAEVAANHAKYFVGLAGWWPSFQKQAAIQRYFNGWLSSGSVITACVVPLLVSIRWTVSDRQSKSIESQHEAPRGSDITGWLIERGLSCLVFAFALFCLAVGVGTSACLALVSLGVAVPLIRGWKNPAGGTPPRFRALAGWLLAAWFVGLLVSTPAYRAYSRLALPWLVSAWLLAGAVIGAWIDSLGNAEIEPARARRPRSIYLRVVVLACFVGLAALLCWKVPPAPGVPGWQDRTVRGRVVGQALQSAVQVSASKPVFLVYGEPSLFFQLASRGADVQPPLGGLDVLDSPRLRLKQPAFLLTSEAAGQTQRLQLLAVFHDTPSDLVLLDKYDPSDLTSPKGRPRDELWLYRVRP